MPATNTTEDYDWAFQLKIQDMERFLISNINLIDASVGLNDDDISTILGYVCRKKNENKYKTVLDSIINRMFEKYYDSPEVLNSMLSFINNITVD